MKYVESGVKHHNPYPPFNRWVS